MTTSLATIPQGANLPAHLQTPEAAAQIAAANAAAAGGIKTGGFPKVSIEGGKFHEIDQSVDGGQPRTYMVAAQPGQPPLPMMCLEAVIIAANPALVKTFYAKKWTKGDDASPDCQSSNGIVPDAFVVNKQSPVCATCQQNQWGSKISEATGKEVKACTDSKQLVILPGADLTYKALGLSVTPAALGEWGKYVKALSDRNIPVNSVVTNVTFDHTASFPKLQFAYNRFLTAEEYTQVMKRVEGDDVKLIISPLRTPPLALLAPAAAAPVAPPAPVQPRPQPPQPPQPQPQPAGFGAAPITPPIAPAAAPAVQGRVRRTRAQIEADNAAKAAVAAPAVDLSYLPPAIRMSVAAVGIDTTAGKAILAQFPKPATVQETVQPAVVTPQPATVQETVRETVQLAGFGASAAAKSAIPAAGITAAGMSLKALLEKKLGINQPAAG